MKQETKKRKKYISIVKLYNKNDGTAKCIKYRFNDLIKFTQFLDTNWSEWKWFNLYSNKLENKGTQLGNFTKNNKPTSKYI
jgi:hypothetical protein